MDNKVRLEIEMFGELAVYHNGEKLTLPSSKRSRALLAYLTLTARPHRRDRLCEVFWKIPDDPRGSLRWALSKIRPLLNTKDKERIAADRERVTFVGDDTLIDVQKIGRMLDDKATGLDDLIALFESVQKPFLAGVDLPEQELFQHWLVAERIESDKLRWRLMNRISNHPSMSLIDRVCWTQRWLALDPLSAEAAIQIVSQLKQLGRLSEAQEQKATLMARFEKAGIAWPQNKAQSSNTPPSEVVEKPVRELLTEQKIQFCKAHDGARIAYASFGEGMPIVKAANWLSHLELDWDAPIWSPLFRALSKDHQFIRYDERGNGLSDWEVDDISFESFVTDLETVVDANGLDKFALLGISQGASVSIEYASRYPEKVSHLILFGGYAAGWRIDADETTIKQREAISTLIETGWGQDNPAYRQIFSSTFMPSAEHDELSWFNEFQRLTTSAENAVRFLSVFGNIDVRERLEKLKVPTLVVHSLRDQRIPVDVGRDLAATIPNAQFIGLDSDGHLLLGREPSSEVFVEAIKHFLASN